MNEQQAWNALSEKVGLEITLRFANGGVTGKLLAVDREPWGYVLHLSGSVGDHFVAFPGEVLHMVVPRA